METDSTTLGEDTKNVSGAMIFLGYILAALLLTAFICRDLIGQYLSLPKSLWNKNDLHKQLRTFASLTLLSFTVLSYHMIDFLLESYQQWAIGRDIELPLRIYGKSGLFGSGLHRTPLYPWSWMKASNLFQDFARSICEPQEHFWWSSQALLFTLAWSAFLSLEGPRRRVPHLAAYAIISQILPVSFAANLFLLALLMRPLPKPQANIWTPMPALKYGPLIAYFVLLTAAQYTIDTEYFISVVIALRLLLFWPLALATMLPRSCGHQLPAKDVREENLTQLIVIGLVSINLVCIQTMYTLASNGFSFIGMIKAVNNNPAVSALGYDYILGSVSAIVWLRSTRSSPDWRYAALDEYQLEGGLTRVKSA